VAWHHSSGEQGNTLDTLNTFFRYSSYQKTRARIFLFCFGLPVLLTSFMSIKVQFPSSAEKFLSVIVTYCLVPL